MILEPSFRRQAFLEYIAAQRWYEKQRFGLGVQFEVEIDHAISRACEAPRRFPEVLAQVRRIRVRRFPFVIYYKVRGRALIVLAVFHARREPAIWQKRS